MKQDKKKITAQDREQINTGIKELDRQLDVIVQKFIDNPEPFFKEREKEIEKAIIKYGDLENQDLEEGKLTKKDYAIQISKSITKPFLPTTLSSRKHTAHTLQATNDWYWNNVVLKVNQTTRFVPSLYHLCKLLGISRQTFTQYATNGNEQMRETCEMIKDEFIDYYQQKGLTKELNDIMAMFVLKTSYGQRENDTPQVLVANINNSPQEKIDKYARQYGFEVWNEE